MRQYPNDYRMWALASGALFVPIVAVWLVMEVIPTGKLPNFMDLMLFSSACAVAGWVFQAIAVVLGIRFVNRPDPQQEVDYDDEMRKGPPRV